MWLTRVQGRLWVSLTGCSTSICDHVGRHLTIRRNVGNTMAAFVMQSLGCDVAALNTVQYSAWHRVFPLQLTQMLNLLQAIIPATSNSKAPRPLPKRSQTSTPVSNRASSQTSMSCSQATLPTLPLWRPSGLSLEISSLRRRRRRARSSGVDSR